MVFQIFRTSKVVVLILLYNNNNNSFDWPIKASITRPSTATQLHSSGSQNEFHGCLTDVLATCSKVLASPISRKKSAKLTNAAMLVRMLFLAALIAALSLIIVGIAFQHIPLSPRTPVVSVFIAMEINILPKINLPTRPVKFLPSQW